MSRQALVALPLLLVSLTATAVGDPGRGADSFDANCAECHSVAKTLKNKKGPTLFGLFGRPAASIAGLDYSPALEAAGFAWNTEKLDLYVTAPKKLVPDGKMKFDGLSDAGERADLLSFLAEQK